MTTIDTAAVVESVDLGTTQPTPPRVLSSEIPGITLCGSYKEAKQLAAAGRRSGNVATQHVRAVYLTSRETWCVK